MTGRPARRDDVGDIRPGIVPTLVGLVCGTGALAPFLLGSATAARAALATVAGVGALALAASGLNPHLPGLRLAATVCGTLGLGAIAALAVTYLGSA